MILIFKMGRECEEEFEEERGWKSQNCSAQWESTASDATRAWHPSVSPRSALRHLQSCALSHPNLLLQSQLNLTWKTGYLHPYSVNANQKESGGIPSMSRHAGVGKPLGRCHRKHCRRKWTSCYGLTGTLGCRTQGKWAHLACAALVTVS